MAALSGVFTTQQFTDLGALLIGGRLYTYAYGTTTQKTVFTDIAGLIPHTYTSDGLGGQYIAINARGELPGSLYLGLGSYDISLKRSDGSTVWTRRAESNEALGVSLALPGGAGMVGGTAQVVNSISGLRALVKSSPSKNAFVTGYYAQGDGGGGAYYYDAADTTSLDNGGTVIVAADGGCWKLQPTSPVSVRHFGALGLGVANDALAISLAVAAHPGRAFLLPDPPVEYRIASPITLPPNTTLVGNGKRSTKLKKYFSGDAFIWQDGAAISHATLDGNGLVFTGGGVVINGTEGRQNSTSFRCINTDGPALEFKSVDAGSQCFFIDPEFSRTGGGTGTNRFAIVMADGVQLAAVPRKFIGLETNGTCAIDFGACNDVFVLGSFMADVKFTPNSRGICIVGGRIANQLALTVNGFNNSIVGCNIAPQVTIAPGADNITIGPGSYNNLPVIDNSGNNRNNVFHWMLAYPSVLSTVGVAPSLGNGALQAEYSRQGSVRRININLTLGSTTSLGTGPIQFSLPEIHRSGLVGVVGTAIINRGGVIYTAQVQIPGNVNYCELIRDTTGGVTFNSPAVFAAGDTIRIGITC